MTEPQELARVFKVLSAESRVRMIELLKHRSLCVNALARHLGMTPAAVSQHLRVLRDAGLVVADRKGYFVHYRADAATMAAWRALADEVLSPEKPLKPDEP